MANKRTTVLMAGAGTFGYWNTGDEAIFSAMVKELRLLMPALEIVLISCNPHRTMDVYGVHEVPIADITGIIEAARNSDLMILGGGGIFFDYWGVETRELLTVRHTGLAFFTSFALLAALLDKPLMIYAAGVGPLFSEAARSLTKLCFGQANVATLRDSGSSSLLHSIIGEATDTIPITADPAFNLSAASPDRIRLILERYATATRPLIGVALRGWPIGVSQQKWQAVVARALDSFIGRHGGTILFISFHRPMAEIDDLRAAQNVMERMKYRAACVLMDEETTPADKAGLIHSCDLLLGMRLHSLIFALTGGVPLVGLAYDPKVSNLLRDAGLDEYGLNLPSLNWENLCNKLSQAYEARTVLSVKLRNRADDFKAMAKQNPTLASALLSRSRPVPPTLPHHTLTMLKRILLDRVVDLQRLDEQAQSLRDTFAGTEQMAVEYQKIVGSDIYRIAQNMSKVRSALVPFGSRREHWMRTVTKHIKYFRGSAVKTQAPAPGSGPAAGSGQATEVQLGIPPSRRGQGAPRILILTPRFFCSDGFGVIYGGAERYLIELVRLLRTFGFKPEVYQGASSPWVREYEGIRIVGLETSSTAKLNEIFHTQVAEGDLTIYLAADLATPRYHRRSVGISHGIFWDQQRHCADPVARQKIHEDMLQAYTNATHVVSVDTNTINWVRTQRAALEHKFSYIPNFVDVERFKPVKKSLSVQNDEPMVVLYPRRLCQARGFWLVLEVLPAILEKYPRVNFHFVGQADRPDEPEEKAVRALVARYNPRVKWQCLPWEHMYQAYAAAHITVIPTISYEGTSHSCLEAMASGNAVIATNVGGLPDLILPDYNGLLINPTGAALKEGLERLLHDPTLRQNIAARGREVALCFSLDRWQYQWTKLLQRLVGHPTSKLD